MSRGLILLALICLASDTYAADIEVEVDIEIAVTNMQNQNGNVVVLVYSEDRADGYPRVAADAVCRVAVATSADSVVAICRDQVPGKYAVYVFHDENANGKADHNFLRLPKEHLGFSNDCRTGLPLPTFEKCHVDVIADRSETHRISVVLRSLL